MLPRQNRIPSQVIAQLFKSGIKTYSNELVISVGKSDTSIPRFAFLVTKKISKLAVTRNRIKRLLRESVWHLIGKFKSVDVVFMVKKDISNLSESEVEKLVESLVRKGGIIK
jgi:ribonuclease P protein component